MANCRVQDCPERQQARGVCIEHFKIILKQVEAGQVTWKQYEEAGICIPIPDHSQPRSQKCLTEECPCLSRARGLCHNCYAAAVRTMNKDNLQWPDLEQLGLASRTRTRNYNKQSAFFKKASKAIAGKKIKDKISFNVPLEPAPPEQPIPVTQASPLSPFVPPGVFNEDDNPTCQGIPGWETPPDLPPVTPELLASLDEGQQEAPMSAIEPPPTIGPPAASVPPYAALPSSAVQTPVGPLEAPERAPAAEEKFPGFKDSTGVAPLPAEQMREVVKQHDFQPALDLSRINAPDPEPTPEDELDAALPVNLRFPPPPTQIPGQEGGV